MPPKISIADKEMAILVKQIILNVELRVEIARIRKAWHIPENGLNRSALATPETEEDHAWMDDFEKTNGSEKYNYYAFREWYKTLKSREQYVRIINRLLKIPGGLSSSWFEFMEELVLFNNPNKPPEENMFGTFISEKGKLHSGAYYVTWSLPDDYGRNQISINLLQYISRADWMKVYKLQVAPFLKHLPQPFPKVLNPEQKAHVLELKRAGKTSIQISAETGLDDAAIRQIISRHKRRKST